MNDVVYRRFVKRWQEVTDLPQEDIGPFTPYYRLLVARLKVMPWPALVLGSLIVVVGLYVLFGGAITKLVSILQKGF